MSVTIATAKKMLCPIAHIAAKTAGLCVATKCMAWVDDPRAERPKTIRACRKEDLPERIRMGWTFGEWEKFNPHVARVWYYSEAPKQKRGRCGASASAQEAEDMQEAA